MHANTIRLRTWLLAALAVAVMDPRVALALINPNFTPVHLVKQSSVILELEIRAAKDGNTTAAVKHVLKGKLEQKSVKLRLTTSTFPEHVKTVEKLLAAPDGAQAILFVGGFADQDGGAAAEEQKAYLHVAGTWVAFAPGQDGAWDMDRLADSMGTTWAGGTDMLLRATEYILSDPAADVPVKEGITWANSGRFATIEGTVHSASAVDLQNDGKLALYVACEGGDRLFKYDAKAGNLSDVTAAAKLTAKSKVATWGDFNADGRMDLLSWDGEALVIHTQSADETFQAGEKLLRGKLADGCLGLTCIDGGKSGHPGAIVSTRGAPLLWRSDEPGTVRKIGDSFVGAELGAPGACLVADLDGDAIPDIVQPFAKSGLVYKGKAPGQFENAKPCAVCLGAGTASAFVGDFDADGLLDVFSVGSDGATHLWANRGKFEFADTMTMTGELAYKGSSGAAGGATGDFNNDGRQDVMLYYAASSPHLYFNRGFRSFGLANGIDVANNDLLPKAEDGQQAGCLADVTGDGAQDLILILKNGEAWAFCADAPEGAARCARGVLSSQGLCVGPLMVTGWRDGRCLGAWNVTAGTSEAFVGLTDAGEVTLKWQFPGKPPQETKVVVESKPVRVVLAPAP